MARTSKAIPSRWPAWAAGLFLLAAMFVPLEARAESGVTSLFTARTTDGSTAVVAFIGQGDCTHAAWQVKWTGTITTVTLNASLDGSAWDPVAIWKASPTASAIPAELATAGVFTAPVVGGLVYRLTLAGCSSCSVDVRATVSGPAQIVTY